MRDEVLGQLLIKLGGVVSWQPSIGLDLLVRASYAKQQKAAHADPEHCAGNP
jgi:hypothetical protein